jgi:NADH:ubiquinone oxidoreductase subunit B-like Fe-S oxidoreductase
VRPEAILDALETLQNKIRATPAAQQLFKA